MNFLSNHEMFAIFNGLLFIGTISILIWFKERTSEVITTVIHCFSIISMDWMSFYLDVLYGQSPDLVRFIWFPIWGYMSGLAIMTIILAHSLAGLKFSKYMLHLTSLYLLSILVNFIAHICRFMIDLPAFNEHIYSPAILVLNSIIFTIVIFKIIQTHWNLRYSMVYKLHALAGKGELK